MTTIMVSPMSPRHGQNEGRHNAWKCRWKDHALDRLGLRGAHRVGAVAHGLCGTALMTSSLSEEMTGTSSMPMTRPAASADSAAIAEADHGLARIAHEGCNRERRKEAQDHGGNARQHFQHGLEECALTVGEAYSAM
jgi:hypothetical protein